MDVTNQIRLERERREALVKGNILQSMGVSESLSKATPTDITKGEKSNELFNAEEIEKAHNELFEKAVYADTAQNRKLGRVGQEWHRGKGVKTDNTSSSRKKKVDREAERQARWKEIQAMREKERKSAENFIKTGKLSEESMKKLVDSIDIKSIPVNVIKTDEDMERVFHNHNSEGTLGRYLTAKTTVGDVDITLRLSYNGYLDLRKNAEVSLETDDDSGSITSYDDDIENEEKLYYKFLDNHLNDFHKEIEKKLTESVQNDKAYKKYFERKKIFDKLDDESFEALSTATKKDLPWLKSQLKNKVTDEDGKNYQQAVKITIKELEGK